MTDPIAAVEALVTKHPFFFTAVVTWLTNYGISAFCSSFPAPTKNSTQFYRFWFKLANNIGAQNPTRGNGFRIEHSPNWTDAVAKENTATSATGNIRTTEPK